MDRNENSPEDAGGAQKAAGALTVFVPPAGAKSAEPTDTAVPRHRRVRAHDRLPIYAAAVCLALGTGGVFGSQLIQQADLKSAEAETAKIERALPWKKDVAEIVARDGGKLRDDLRALRGELAALRANNDQLRQAEGQRQAQELRAMRTTLEGQKAETASLKADMAARFDRADRDASQRADKAVERVDRLEKHLADPVVTASVPKPVEAPKPAPEAKPEKPPVRGMVLRDVERGIALIETQRGMLEVMAGDVVPGVGRIETIEKHAGRWRVVTSNGIINDRLN